ncbi:MAG: hypothetical protein EOP84_02045 [Verrucomicrobiaceae bacterium]|nr:MAG: hypothetical protein EOP84_02045 [Verrucomicrobiaceae bacterium]
MINLLSDRHQVLQFIDQCFGYIDIAKTTWLKNVPPQDEVGYKVQLIANSVISETQSLFRTKYARTTRAMIKFELSVAQAIALLQVLQHLPMRLDDVYMNAARANWIAQLDQALIAMEILRPRERPAGVPGAPNYD